VSFFTSPKIDLQRIQSAANIAALFFWQSSQMLSGFFFDLKPVAHCRFPAAKLIPPAGRIQDGCSSVKERFGEAAETRTRVGTLPGPKKTPRRNLQRGVLKSDYETLFRIAGAY